ncbi:MAG: aromatic amino acid lyase, partial [Bdellovibrionales bacterium]|nr:aromatic amino acid lyase [Bdellovibrionales bacterium]
MIEISGSDLKINDVWQVSQGAKVSLSEKAKEKILLSRSYIENKISTGDAIYGVNTGFGAFSSVRITDSDIEKLQFNLIRSHSTGVGEPFTVAQTRAIMALRANALATGHSGVRLEVIETILEFMNQDVIPVIPQQGSVGASGDLAPLSHLALALIGEGEVWSDGKVAATDLVLKKKNIQPLVLKAKEGLSLINGCQVMTAVGLLATYESSRFAKLMDVAGAMSLEALQGSRKAFDPLIPATRRHPG